jgi:hypothetical protein
MSEIDRVFARLGGGQAAGSDQRELLNIPRKGNSTGSRVVEVVRLPSRRTPAGQDQAQRPAFKVRAQTWEDGFPARTAAPAAPPPEPPAVEAPEPVAHVMPLWERTVVAPEPEPPPPPAEAPQPRQRRTAAGRGVADPFDAGDDRANCLRCGYVVEQARERRGLLTCAACG